MPYRVLIVDDQIISRQLFESIIASSQRYTLVGSIDSASVADVYCAGNRVDLILMDVVMSDGSNGLDAAARIKSSYPDIRILIVTSMPDAAFLKKARQIGADSFWYKEVQDQPMLAVMDRTMAGESIYPDSAPITRIGAALSDEFTERELEVLRELVSGKTDAAIAETLCLSVTRVKQHIQRIREKTQFANRTELAVRARESGLVIGDYKHL